jgi:hypothetical protein
LACEREGIDADEMAACVLHPLQELDSQSRVVEWEKIDQDWRRRMENDESGTGPNKGTMPSSSGTEEPIQQRVVVHDGKVRDDTMRKEVQERCLDSDVTGVLNQRKEQVGEEKQLAEQGKLKLDKSRLSKNVDQIHDVMNKRNSKL